MFGLELGLTRVVPRLARDRDVRDPFVCLLYKEMQTSKILQEKRSKKAGEALGSHMWWQEISRWSKMSH